MFFRLMLIFPKSPTAFRPVEFRVSTCHCGFGLYSIITLKLKEIPVGVGGASHLAGVLLFESRRLLQEKSEGVAELRSRPGPDVPARVHDFPAARRDTQRPR